MPPKSDKAPQDHSFEPGSVVEISSDDEGFRGSWFLGTVIRCASAKKPVKYLVQYDTLFADESGKKPLREVLYSVQLRPVAPREKNRKFNFGELVDAYYNDGWWEGAITEDCGDGKFAVFFRSSRDQIVFGEADLRLHREWVNGEWKPPLLPEENEVPNGEKQKTTSREENGKTMTEEKTASLITSSSEVKLREAKRRRKLGSEEAPSAVDAKAVDAEEAPSAVTKNKFSKGMLVEVSSDEDGFEGAWFATTIIEAVGKDKYLVQYHNLRTEDDTDFLREEINVWNIRPSPPVTVVVDRFKLMEEVDAWYSDAWWEGTISKVRRDSKYTVYFKYTNEELVFEHSDLRPHQDWISGKWVTASQAL